MILNSYLYSSHHQNLILVNLINDKVANRAKIPSSTSSNSLIYNFTSINFQIFIIIFGPNFTIVFIKI